MFTRFAVSLVALAFSLACGADNGDLFEEESDGGEFGEAEQTYEAPIRGPSFVYGTRTGSTHEACDATSTGQVCTIPSTRTFRYAIECTGCTSAQSTRFTNAVEAAKSRVVAAGFNWPVSLVLSDANPAPVFVFRKSSVGTVSTTSNAIENYVRVRISGSPTGLTEASGVAGNYQKAAKQFIDIDQTDIEGRGTSTAADSTAMVNLAVNGMEKAVGIGGFPQDNTRCASNALPGIKFTSACLVESTETCAMNGFSVNNTTGYAHSATNCGS